MAAARKLLFPCFGAFVALSAPAARAAGGVCALVQDSKDPALRAMQCDGERVAVREEPGARYALDPAEPPTRLRLDAGALMVEFHPGSKPAGFEVLTPIAIAAVRGTKWVVDAQPGGTSVFVIAGRVAVTRAAGGVEAVLHRGDGVDVAAGTDPLTVNRWKHGRVRALLARFGL